MKPSRFTACTAAAHPLSARVERGLQWSACADTLILKTGC